MKVNDGYWLIRDGWRVLHPVDVLDVATTADSVTVTALTRRFTGRGAELNTATLTVRLSSPAPGVIGVHAAHLVGGRPRTPAFELSPTATTVVVEQDEHQVSLTSGDLTARIDTATWRVTFEAEGRVLTDSGPKCLGAVTDPDGAHHMIERLALGVGEHVYGLGERFTPFVKNGQVIDTWNADGGTASDQAYKSVPFYLSDAGYGVFIASPDRVELEVASEVVSRVQFTVPGQELEYYVIHGPSPKEVLSRYTALTGRPALPPLWSFGLWLSTSFTTDYDEATVTGVVQQMAERDLPLSVLHFDCYWMRPLQWCDFEWDPDVFPDPAAMLARLAERGLHVSVWINPYLGQTSPLFAEAAEAGYLVRRPDGDVWQWDMWVAGMGLVDFTNPAAREWYAGKVTTLLRNGVHCVKTDFGERIPTQDVVWHDGSDPQRMHNYYSYLYNRTVFEAVQAERGVGEAVVFARSATAGGQQFPVHWGGDCESSFVSMAESLRGGLSLGLSGFGFWSHDIGGFEGTPSPEVFKRWVAFGLLSSHSRLHGSGSMRVPWDFDDEAVDVLRRFTRLKLRLMPYLWAAAVEAHEDGVPMMRAMLLEFSDPTCATLDTQYLLGPDLLVAPVFSADGDVTYYLPDGAWTHLLTGEVLQGPRWVRERHGFDSLPLLVRPGAVVPVGAYQDRPDRDLADGVAFEVFGLPDGEERTVTVHAADGAVAARVRVRRDGGVVRATVDKGVQALGAWRLRWVTGAWGTAERGREVVASAGDTELLVSLD